MNVRVAYGREGLNLDLPDHTAVIVPNDPPPLPDERSAFERAVRGPIGAKPLREVIAATDRVVIVTSDIT
ncbi:MAG: DUF2088 domain-containing protein, partial [Candidatus Eremiobacteraeota bacterium]|nr:DUF2088 domain-containing protein [Candidatus Eremiobacteraeota bacterium]